MPRIFLFLVAAWLYLVPVPMSLRAQSSVPAAAQVLPSITRASVANAYQITWPSVNGRTYFVQMSTNLQTWTYCPFVELGTGQNITWGFSSNGPRYYLRLKYADTSNQVAGAGGDLDGDGISNVAEVAATVPTDPFVFNTGADSDNDGLSDAWERLHFGNLTSATGQSDTDGDGLNNSREAREGTNPNKKDTDNDGVWDLAELNAGTSPLDFYNGQIPDLIAQPTLFGDVPTGFPGEWMDEVFTIKVCRPGTTTPYPQAPLTWVITQNGAGLAEGQSAVTTRSDQPTLIQSADALGLCSAALRLGTSGQESASIRAFVRVGTQFRSVAFTAYPRRSLDYTGATLFQTDQFLSASGSGTTALVDQWEDATRTRRWSALGGTRPNILPAASGRRPLLKFNGTQVLGLTVGAPLAAGSHSVVAVARPEAPTVSDLITNFSAAPTAALTPGLTGQRFLLTSSIPAGSPPWVLTQKVVDSTANVTGKFSRYNHRFFPGTGQNYAAIPTTTKLGGLTYEYRFDVTPSNKYRGPLESIERRKAGGLVSDCQTDFLAIKGWQNFNYRWERDASAKLLHTVSGTTVFEETYYTLRGFDPDQPAYWTWTPANIGACAPGFSIGTNTAGTYQMQSNYAPCLGRISPVPAVSALTVYSCVVDSSASTLYANGVSPNSASVPTGGGTFSGFSQLGARGDVTQGYIGTLGDLAIVNHVLNDASRELVEDSLAHRHRIQLDRDGDALPDWWERQHFDISGAAANSRPTALPTADNDNDGLPNSQEYTLKTNPERSDSDGDGLSDTVESGPASSTNALNPDSDGDGFLDGSDPTPANPSNGRADANNDGIPDGFQAIIKQTESQDSDNDGLSDLTELLWTKTNPLISDTDGDGLSDQWENTNGLDPLDPGGANGANGDPDQDGVSNYQEYLHQFNPFNAFTLGTASGGDAAQVSRQPMLKRLVRTLKYDYDDYETASQAKRTLITTAWNSPNGTTTPLSAAIPFTELANRLASAHAFPTVPPAGFETPLGQALMITNNSNLLPSPPCYHARLEHNQVYLTVAVAPSAPLSRSFLLVTKRTVDGKEVGAAAPQVVTLTIDPSSADKTSSPPYPLISSFSQNFTDNKTHTESIEQNLLPVEFEVLEWKTELHNPIFTYIRDAPNLPDEYVSVGGSFGTLTPGNFEAMVVDAKVKIKIPTDSPQANLIAAQYDLFLYQNILTNDPNEVRYQTGAVKSSVTPLPGMDANSGPSGYADEDSIPRALPFTTNNQTITIRMSDSPGHGRVPLQAQIAGTTGYIKSIKQETTFCTWLFAQHRTTNERVFLKWFTWKTKTDVDFRTPAQNDDLINVLTTTKIAEGTGRGSSNLSDVRVIPQETTIP